MSLHSCLGKLKPKALPAADRTALLKSIEGLPVAKQDAAALKAVGSMLAEARNNVKYLHREILSQHKDKFPQEVHDVYNNSNQQSGVSTEPSGESMGSAEPAGRSTGQPVGQPESNGLDADRPSAGENNGAAGDVLTELKSKIAQINEALDNADVESTKYKVLERQLAKAKNELRKLAQATPEAKAAEKEAEGYSAWDEAVAGKSTGNEKAAPAHSIVTAQNLVNQELSKWTNAPKATVKSLTQMSGEELAYAKTHDGWFETKTGNIVIVHENNADLSAVKATLFHEALGHYGLRSKFAGELRGMLQRMYESNPKLKAMADQQVSKGAAKDHIRGMEEVLADSQMEGGVEQRLIDTIRVWLNRLGRAAGMNIAYTEADVRSILRRAQAGVVSGKYVEGAVQAAHDADRSEEIWAGSTRVDDLAPALELKQRSEYLAPAVTDPKGLAGVWQKASAPSTWDTAGNKIFGAGTVFEGRAEAKYGTKNLFDQNGKLLGNVAYALGQNVRNLIVSVLDMGHLEVHKSGAFYAVEDKNNIKNMATLVGKVDHAATAKYGEKEAKIGIQNALLMGRYNDVKARNARLEVEMERLYNEGKRKQAKKLEDKLIDVSEFTAADQASGIKFLNEFPELREALNIYSAVRAKTLAAAVSSGLYSQEKAEEFLAAADWVPFYRTGFESEGTGSDIMHGKGFRSYTKEHKFKGSSREVANVMDNIIKNSLWLNERIVRNSVANSMANTMHAMGEGKWLSESYTPSSTDVIVPIARNGEVQKFAIHDPNMAAPFLSYPVLNSMSIRMASEVSNFLRKAITLTPAFALKQTLMEDPMRVALTAGMSQGLLRTFGNNIKLMFSNSHLGKQGDTKEALHLQKYGVIGGFDTVDGFQSSIDRVLGKPQSVFQRAVEKGELLLRASDLASRINVSMSMEAEQSVELKRMKESGATAEALKERAEQHELERAYAASNIMRFGNKGTSTTLRTLMRMAPFINPRLQGMRLMYKAAQGRIPGVTKAEGQRRVAMKAAQVMGMWVLYAMMMSGDDEFEAQSENDRANNFLIPVPGSKSMMKFAIPPEYLPFKVAADAFARTLMENPNQDEAAFYRQMGKAITAQSFNWGADMLPSVVKPVAEHMTNLSFFSMNPLVGPSLAQRDPAMQYTDKTSEFAKTLGKTTGYSPVLIDNYLKGYFGSMASISLDVTNAMFSDTPVDKMPLLGQFQTSEYANGYKEAYYDLRDEYTKAAATAKAMETGDADDYLNYVMDHQNALALKSYVSSMDTGLKQVRDQKRLVNASDLSVDEKKEFLTQLADTERQLLKDVHGVASLTGN